jgi:hypothetical protein
MGADAWARLKANKAAMLSSYIILMAFCASLARGSSPSIHHHLSGLQPRAASFSAYPT